MEFELEYQLKDFREIQDQYFDEDNKCYSKFILSTNIAEKMLNLIDKLSERVNELEPAIKQQIKKSLPINMLSKTELLEIDEQTIDCYRGTSYGCIIYMKNGDELRTQLTFKEVFEIFNCA